MERGMWVSLFQHCSAVQRLLVMGAFFSVRALAPAQIPGLTPLLPLQSEGGFRLAVQPETAAFCGWAHIKGPARFELVSGLNAITSRTQSEAMLLQTLPCVQDFAFSVGLGFAVDRWSYGANWSMGTRQTGYFVIPAFDGIRIQAMRHEGSKVSLRLCHEINDHWEVQILGSKGNAINREDENWGLSTSRYAQSEIQFRLMLNL